MGSFGGTPTSAVKRYEQLKARASGRTEFQTMEDVKHRARVERTFQRSHSKTSFLRSTFSGVPSCDTSRTFTPTTASPDISSRVLRKGGKNSIFLYPSYCTCTDRAHYLSKGCAIPDSASSDARRRLDTAQHSATERLLQRRNAFAVEEAAGGGQNPSKASILLSASTSLLFLQSRMDFPCPLLLLLVHFIGLDLCEAATC
ncbi:FERM adjacent [Ancylostoma ceylanicum]|uniref:FERM adjacent n=1 Tax=Ancylostoma ceylanicum TaxID=53326 RepID=A0A0D6LNQ3_9BILA|nr:FERM adjacent [Ancylostoma ceylanicum]